LEKRPKLNSQLATVSELCRLIVAADNNNDDVEDSPSLAIKTTLAEILEISSFDFSCLLVEEEDETKMTTTTAAVEPAAISIAASISHLTGWLNEHFSAKNEPKVASRFLCRTLLNAPDVLQDALFTSSDVRTFAKTIASDYDRRRRREVNAALALLLDFLLDENAPEAKNIKNTIEDLMLSNTQNEGNEVLIEAKLREVFFFSSSLSSSVFVKKREKIEAGKETPTPSASTPKPKTRKRKQTPGSGAKNRRAEKRAAKNKNSE
jgi:hypothetical protein